MVAVNDSILSLIAGKVKPVQAPSTRRMEQSGDGLARRGRRAILNLLPDYDSLNEMIAQARAALANGIFWDRGSIINIIL